MGLDLLFLSKFSALRSQLQSGFMLEVTVFIRIRQLQCFFLTVNYSDYVSLRPNRLQSKSVSEFITASAALICTRNVKTAAAKRIQ